MSINQKPEIFHKKLTEFKNLTEEILPLTLGKKYIKI